MDSGSNRAPLLPPVDPASLPAPHRGRAAFLAILATGVVLFLVFLPAEERASLWAGLIGQRALVVLLAVFAALTLSLIGPRGQRLDARVFVLLNMRVYPTWLDRGMWFLTQLGTMVPAFVVAFAVFLLKYSHLAAGLVLGTVTLWILVEAIKLLSYRARPFLTIEQARVVGWREIGTSFPSGHTAQAFFLSTLLVQHFQPGVLWAAGLYAVAALVGFTRIYVGAHYPRDVIAGVVLGSVWGLLAWLVAHGWFAMVSS